MPKLIVHCDMCNLPIMVIQNGAIILESKHYGKKHTSVIGLQELVRRWEEHIGGRNRGASSDAG